MNNAVIENFDMTTFADKLFDLLPEDDIYMTIFDRDMNTCTSNTDFVLDEEFLCRIKQHFDDGYGPIIAEQNSRSVLAFELTDDIYSPVYAAVVFDKQRFLDTQNLNSIFELLINQFRDIARLIY